MSTVNSTTSSSDILAALQKSTSGSSTSSTSGTTADSQASFLKLLTEQLKNQDPTKPMDSTEYVSQLATLSQVEQATQTNKKLDSLLSSSFLDQADAIIGRTVTSADGTVSGVVTSVKVTGDGAVATLRDGSSLLLQSGISVS